MGHCGERMAVPAAHRGPVRGRTAERAADQSLAGIVANDPAEAAYLAQFTDDTGASVLGDSRYELQFTGDNLPR